MFQKSPRTSDVARLRHPRRWIAAIGVAFVALTPGLALAEPAADVIPNPPGSFLVRRSLSIPANPFDSDSVFLNSDLLHQAGVANRYLLGNVEGCQVRGDADEAHPFVTDTVQITKSGTYTFRIVHSPGVDDPFLALYSGGFNKSMPDSNVEGCNDDIDTGGNPIYAGVDDDWVFDNNGYDDYVSPAVSDYDSLFEVNLEPGTYIIMLTTFTSYEDNYWWYYDDNGDLEVASSGVGTMDRSGPATAVFEYWGPNGGIEGGVGASPSSGPSFGNDGYLDHLNELVATETASDLPDTGATVNTLNMIFGLACLAVGSTFVAVSRRRRYS